MPYKIVAQNTTPLGDKIAGTKRYKVINEETRDVKAKYSTLRNAQKQVRLLNSLEKSPIKWRS